MAPSPFHGIFNFGSEVSPRGTEIPASNDSVQLETEEDTVTVEPHRGERTGQIAVDIYERDDYYIIRAPIAGVKLSDLDIEIDGKVVTIRGRRQPAEDIPKDQFYLEECFWGEFRRSITLPSMVDPKRVKATFSKDCILKVLVPKEEKVKIVRVSEG